MLGDQLLAERGRRARIKSCEEAHLQLGRLMRHSDLEGGLEVRKEGALHVLRKSHPDLQTLQNADGMFYLSLCHAEIGRLKRVNVAKSLWLFVSTRNTDEMTTAFCATERNVKVLGTDWTSAPLGLPIT